MNQASQQFLSRKSNRGLLLTALAGLGLAGWVRYPAANLYLASSAIAAVVMVGACLNTKLQRRIEAVHAESIRIQIWIFLLIGFPFLVHTIAFQTIYDLRSIGTLEMLAALMQYMTVHALTALVFCWAASAWRHRSGSSQSAPGP